MKKSERPPYYVLDKENETVKECLEWIKAHPKAWKQMQQLALDKHEQLLREGQEKPRLSARLIVERLRWDYARVEISNNFVPVLARLLIYSCPSLIGTISLHKTATERIVTTPAEKADVIRDFRARCA